MGDSLFYIAPMVCFCDIPLGGVKVHLRRYGNYGLGIHKNFCKKADINPVFYIHNFRAFDLIFPGPLVNFASVVPYIKKYAGISIKKGDEVRFYDEREWRYVDTKKVYVPLGNRDEALRKCRELNRQPARHLLFNPDDVEYVIVENKTEIYKMCDFIEQQPNMDRQKKKLLHTKIISATRIKNDF